MAVDSLTNRQRSSLILSGVSESAAGRGFSSTKSLSEASGLSVSGIEQEVWTYLSPPLSNPRVDFRRSSALIVITKTPWMEIGFSERMAIALTTNVLSVA